MDRRGFLRSLIGGVAAGAAVRTFPFRVFSFPSFTTGSAISTYNLAPFATIYYNKQAIEVLKENLKFHHVMPFNGNYLAVVHPKRAAELKMFQYDLMPS